MKQEKKYSLSDVTGLFDPDLTSLSPEAEKAVIFLITTYYENRKLLDDCLKEDSLNNRVDIWQTREIVDAHIITMTVIKDILIKFLNSEGTLLPACNKLELVNLYDIIDEFEKTKYPYYRNAQEAEILRELRNKLIKEEKLK